MANKYSRHQSVINRQSDGEYSENHWLKQFEEKLQKGAVQPRGESLFDQISTIMNSKGKYPSVQAAVDDMMHRSGLSDYLTKVKTSTANEEIATPSPKMVLAQNASQTNKNLPKVFQEKPSMLQTLENIMQETRGNMPLLAIIDRLKAAYGHEISDESAWNDEDLIRFVSQYNLKAKKDNPANYENYSMLGKGDHSTADSDVDPSNTDAFNALMPAKI